MRYDDWDVILFPKDSHVPIQEFKTACYVSPDENGRQLPTLTSYISSLPPSTPFRISVHSWAKPAKASTFIESQRKASQKAVYLIEVIIDKARVFRGFFDIGSKWPQEIAHEKRSLTSIEQPTSQRKQCLQFPSFHRQALLQKLWDARNPGGRIQIVLSEQLVSKVPNLGDLNMGAANDIVCFSFEHAPKDVLEQAGISWPIRNPLYLPSAYDQTIEPMEMSPSISISRFRPQAADIQMESPLAHSMESAFAQSQVCEPHWKPNSHLPSISNFQMPPPSVRGRGRTNIWEDSFAPFGDGGDDVSMDTWSTKRTASGSTGDMAMPDYMYTSSLSSKQMPPWRRNKSHFDYSTSNEGEGHRPRREKEKRVVVTLQDDQLGQIIEALSPPKQNRELPDDYDDQHQELRNRPSTAHTYFPPKMAVGSANNNSSSAAPARTSSYADLNGALRNASNMRSPEKSYSQNTLKNKPTMMYRPSTSSNKENCPPSQSRLPTPYPHANRVPTPNPFAQRLPTFNSDASMRDPSMVNASASRFHRGETPSPFMEGCKISSAHGPSAVNIRSRKEGMASNSPKLPDHNRHDQSLLPTIDGDYKVAPNLSDKYHDEPTRTTQKSISTLVEVIDVDAIDPHLDTTINKPSPFRPIHKSGISLSSVDSTGRIERQLYSALGEYEKYEEQLDNNGMGPELARALGGGGCGTTVTDSGLSGTTMLNPNASEFEPVGKRKRGEEVGEMGDAADRIPVAKKKGDLGVGEDAKEEAIMMLRGD